jgi:uncharacterized Zn-binding protein involved in type VI secretion
MPASAIVSSIGTGVCYGHPPFLSIPMIGVVITGSEDKQIENNGAARVSDIVMGHCGHIGVIVSGEANVNVDSENQAIVGSSFNGIFS